MNPIVTGAQIFRSKRILTAVDIRALDTTPVLVAPAIPGKSMMPVGVFQKYIFGTTPFHTGSASADLYYGQVAIGSAGQITIDNFAPLIDAQTQSQGQNLNGLMNNGTDNLSDMVDLPVYLVAQIPGFNSGDATAATVDPANKGLLYALNDTGTIQAGGATDPTYTVTGVGAGGLVTTVTVTGGTGITVGGPFPTTVVTGSGDGTLQLNITAVTALGDGTVEIDFLYQPI